MLKRNIIKKNPMKYDTALPALSQEAGLFKKFEPRGVELLEQVFVGMPCG